MATEDAAREIETLRAELVDVGKRLSRAENLLLALYGPHCLGGPSPVAPDPEPKPPRTKMIGTIGGHFWTGPR